MTEQTKYPRCRWGSATDDQCPNPATVELLEGSGYRICEQHFVDHELTAELEEWQDAEFYARQWVALSGHVGNPAIREIATFARLECETRIERLKAEIERVWEGDDV